MIKQNEQALLELIRSGKGTYGISIDLFQTKEGFVHNEDELFYSASIIKVPIMAAVFAYVFDGKCTLSDKVAVSLEDIVPGDGIIKNLTPGLEWTIYDLVVLMIIESDNTATNVLIDLVGIDRIRTYMREWGFNKRQLHHKLQINPTRKPGEMNVITAYEINEFMKKIAMGLIISINACSMMIQIMKQQKMNDLLPSLLPEGSDQIGMIPNWEMAHKTGYVPGIEHNTCLFYLPGSTIAVTVLSKDVPSRDEPRQIMGRIGELLYLSSKK